MTRLLEISLVAALAAAVIWVAAEATRGPG